YGSLILYGKPRDGQSLDDVEQLLWQEIEKLQKGDFEDWLPAAVVKDLKLHEVKEFEKNQGRAAALTGAFVHGVDWHKYVHRWADLEKITKKDVVDFARKYLRKDNYAVVYKHTGDDSAVMKVEKPPITAVELNRTDSSSFAQAFLEKHVPDIEPQFVDFKKTIQKSSVAGLTLRAVQDEQSRLFRLHYVYDFGRNSDRKLAVLASYLPFLSTSRYTASQLQQAFFRLGVHFNATCQDDHFYITLSGLSESYSEAVELMEHVLADAQPNPDALQNLVADIFTRRENDKRDKRTILSKAMLNYAKYGPSSSFSDKLSREELLALKPGELTDLARKLRYWKHELYYFGPAGIRKAANVLKKFHFQPETFAVAPSAKKYRERSIRRNQVYFVHFPMVQVELLLVSRGTPRFNLEEFVFAEWYNQYFGYGLSSIVFQEIRESKALAYSAYAYAATPSKKRAAHFLQSYVGTQPDKLREAVDAFDHILENMPVSNTQIENARQSVLKQISAGAIHKADLYWTWRTNRDRGFLNRDLRAEVYQTLSRSEPDALLAFQQKYIRGRKYAWMVLGDRSKIDFDYLKKIGPVKELTLEEIFGY
ncbi:MAG: insulinase family protein, partial [Saprospiraceae bacterium]|nr:insulinase family protein [Saprospiraceae bacterium]